MSQANFDDLDASGDLGSDIFGSEALDSSDFGSASGFGEADLVEADSGDFGTPVAFEDAESDLMNEDDAEGFHEGTEAPVAASFRKQGFSIYTLMLILSFLSLTATAIIMFTYAESL